MKIDIDNLIISFLNEKISPEDLLALRKWVNESPANKDYFRQIENTWLLSNVVSSPIAYNKEKAYSSFQEKVNKEKRSYKIVFFRKLLAYAAAIIIVFFIGGFATYFIVSPQSSPLLSYSVEAPRRAKIKMNLPDGSIVWLNSDSKLSYNNQFGITNRNLVLDGEGYFDIKHNAKLELTVATGNTKVQVLGTKFNVRNYSNDENITVALLAGKVEFFAANGESAILKPNNTLTYKKRSRDWTIKNVSPEYMNTWINNNLCFEDEKFIDISRNLERAFDVNIKFKSEGLKNLTFYGNITIKADNLNQILSMMSSTNKFHYNYNENKKQVEIYP